MLLRSSDDSINKITPPPLDILTSVPFNHLFEFLISLHPVRSKHRPNSSINIYSFIPPRPRFRPLQSNCEEEAAPTHLSPHQHLYDLVYSTIQLKLHESSDLWIVALHLGPAYWCNSTVHAGKYFPNYIEYEYLQSNPQCRTPRFHFAHIKFETGETFGSYWIRRFL